MKIVSSEIDDRLRYTPIYRGQCAYITYRCFQNNIKLIHSNGDIIVPAYRYLKRVSDIVLESLDKKGMPAELKEQTKAFWYGRALWCVLMRDSDVTFVPDSRMAEVVRYQFLGVIPVTMKYKIYSKISSLKEDLLKHGLLL